MMGSAPNAVAIVRFRTLIAHGRTTVPDSIPLQAASELARDLRYGSAEGQ